MIFSVQRIPLFYTITYKMENYNLHIKIKKNNKTCENMPKNDLG